MTVPAAPVPGLRLGPPVEVGADATACDRARADLSERGTALLYADRRDLRPPPGTGEDLRGLLGRDWPRYLDLAGAEVRDRYAVSRLLAGSVARVLRGDPDALEIAYGPTGRPYLRGYGHIDISLSRAGELLVVGLTTQGLIGVDAEHTGRELYGSELGRRVCTAYETITLAALPEEQRNPRLVRLLTLKAAYSKAIGQGTRLPFTEFGFGPDGRPMRARRPDGSPGSGDEWTFRTFPLTGGHCVSVAVYDAGDVPPGGTGPAAPLGADRGEGAEGPDDTPHGP
ncbi:4'-phosphopantetheinyl transferase superfamily protein [Streptomyces sp. HPF1205]|uniref:4'-phosphopantetheinyl transferase family protein n=1 Tax=Streptomyces sp. HPF1205 TaxID=2873262 RepID=UPI001CED1CF8|nr:4'-phosphopantetheinyl transferase superfamily protein [Streptomyces sp. HPF1205]